MILPLYLRNPRVLRARLEQLALQFQCWLPARSWNLTHVFVLLLFIPTSYYIFFLNAMDYLFALPFFFFQYPLHVDLPKLVDDVINNRQPDVEPLTTDKHPIILDNDKMCRDYDGEQEDVYILYVIKSQPDNFALRQAIRDSWGQEYLISGLKTRRVFMLGVKSSDQDLQRRVGMEHQDFQDIVQGYFQDNAFNNTAKTMMAFQWATTRCHGASFIAFLDDHYFISTYNLAKYLRSVPDSRLSSFMGSYVWNYGTPDRTHDSETYVSLEQYPYMFWPPYPAGGNFFISQQAAQKMFVAMHYVTPLKFDDIFIGITAWKLGIPIQNMDNMYFLESEKKRVNSKHRDVVGAHKFKDPDELLLLWKRHNAVMSRLGRT